MTQHSNYRQEMPAKGTLSPEAKQRIEISEGIGQRMGIPRWLAGNAQKLAEKHPNAAKIFRSGWSPVASMAASIKMMKDRKQTSYTP